MKYLTPTRTRKVNQWPSHGLIDKQVTAFPSEPKPVAECFYCGDDIHAGDKQYTLRGKPCCASCYSRCR